MKMKSLNSIKKIVAIVALLAFVSSCYDVKQKAESANTTDWTGVEYAPQMYHAEAYEPLTQVTDKDAGLIYWPFERVGGGVSDYDTLVHPENDDKTGHGEWYNTNYYNKHGMNMRTPPIGAVARGEAKYIYNIPVDSISQWAALQSPLKGSGVVKGQQLYMRFCKHCHGENGDGKGAVGYPGVPGYHCLLYTSPSPRDA